MTTLASAQSERYEGRVENGGIPLRLGTPRIPPVTSDTWTAEQRAVLESRVGSDGGIMNVFATMASIHLQFINDIEYIRG